MELSEREIKRIKITISLTKHYKYKCLLCIFIALLSIGAYAYHIITLGLPSPHSGAFAMSATGSSFYIIILIINKDYLFILKKLAREFSELKTIFSDNGIEIGENGLEEQKTNKSD